MPKLTKKRAVVVAGLVAIIVAAVSVYAFRERLLESWHLHQLESGNDAEQLTAAACFTEHPTPKAVPGLLRKELAQQPAISRQTGDDPAS
jgi:hypothetical protein